MFKSYLKEIERQRGGGLEWGPPYCFNSLATQNLKVETELDLISYVPSLCCTCIYSSYLNFYLRNTVRIQCLFSRQCCFYQSGTVSIGLLKWSPPHSGPLNTEAKYQYGCVTTLISTCHDVALPRMNVLSSLLSHHPPPYSPSVA